MATITLINNTKKRLGIAQKALLGFAILLSPALARAQMENTMPFMENIQQSTLHNPTAMSDYKFSIGTGINAGFRNSDFSYSDFASKQANGNVLIDPGLIAPKISGNNFTYVGYNLDLLMVKLRVRNVEYNFNVSNRTKTYLNTRPDMYELLWRGNGGFNSRNAAANLDNTAVNATNYNEIGFGAAWQKNERWVLGARVKLLFGQFNANSTNFKGQLKTDTTGNYGLNFQNSYTLNTSTGAYNPNDKLNSKGVGSLIGSFSNPGLAVDLGLKYKPNNDWEFSGMVNDLGFIHWGQNVKNYSGSLTAQSFNGLQVTKVIINNNNIDAGTTGDTIGNRFKSSETANAYSTMLVANSKALAKYRLGNSSYIAAGVIADYFKGIHPSYNINFQQNYKRWLNVLLQYTVQHGKYDNVGLGLMVKPGPIQFYVVADNLNAFITPGAARLFSINTGINIVTGRPTPKDTDGDGVPDLKDECPLIKGLKMLNGCPDRDLDGIADSKDQCPDVAGLPQFEGCPDTDEDGVQDSKDSCITVKGPLATNGCPDTDGDGVIDKLDKCPTVPGLAQFNGCPDTDGDGIEDSKDLCPTEKGTLAAGGCPDRDGDSVADKDDKCPDEAGLVALQGCPEKKVEAPSLPQVKDTDGDGLLDNIDECPLTAGPASNKGCPVLKVEEQQIINTAFKNLEFETGKDVIKATSFTSLKELATLISKHPEFRLKVSGHTDNKGVPASNMILSKKRALAVQNYLVKNGADASRIKSEWFGQTKPKVSNKTEAGRTTNRRVEMKVLFE